MALEIPSLGRPFSLGMLYDCREEKLIPGMTLWDMEHLARNISSVPQNYTHFEVLTSDSVSDKSSALNVSGDLKISLLCGMINFEGSGNYFSDTKESKKQVRVTLKYKRTTKFEQLTMNHFFNENIAHQNVFDNGMVTHVVTGILYGAQAFFIFDQKITNSQTAKDVQGKLQGMVTKIGRLTGEMRMNDEENEVARQFSCKFYGDFGLEKNPVTYEEAVQIYTSLPRLIGENGERAVPIKVWLYPLKKLDSRAARLVREISDHLVFRAEDIMQQMSEVTMECNDMMRHPAAITFPDLSNKINQFRKLFERFRLMFQKQLSQVLPSVRSGNMEESGLEEILTMKEKSPFSDQKIRTFLDRRWKEMELVHTILQRLTPKFRIVTDQRELTNIILHSSPYEFIHCFNIFLAYEDSYLSHLKSWLYREPWDVQDVFRDDQTERLNDYAADSVCCFYAYTLNNPGTEFLVTSVMCSRGPGINVHFYNKGNMVTSICPCINIK